jgi:hypothetical protein
VYDMYSWDQAAPSGSAQHTGSTKPSGRPADDHNEPAPAPGPAAAPTRAAQAVQVALDRRDNGGEASR